MVSFRGKRRLAVLAVPACLVGLAVAVAGPAPVLPWAGLYAFEQDAGRTVGGSPMIVTYRLDIAPGRGNRDCLLRIEGFQTDETIVCKLEGDAASVSVDFHTYGDGRLVNAYGTKLYDVGTPLFTLRRTGSALVTQWRALTPDGVREGTADAAFRRQR